MALTYRTLGKMEDSIKQLVADVKFLVDFCAGINGYVIKTVADSKLLYYFGIN